MGAAHEPRCRICQHPDRAAIEQAIVNGRALRDIARTFGIGSHPGTPDFRPDHKIISRHRDEHMSALWQQTRTETLEEQGNALHRRMDELDAAVNETLGRARKGTPRFDIDGLPVLDPQTGEQRVDYPDRLILAAVREARRNVDMRARLEELIPEGDADAVATARAALENPEARRAVADLEALLAQASSPEQGK